MKREMLKIAIIVIAFTFLCACKTSNQIKDGKENVGNKISIDMKKVVKEILNPNKTKLLILNYSLKNSPIVTYNYKVIDSKTKKELKKGVFTGTDLNWLDNSTLKGTPHIGMIEKENPEFLDETKKKDKFVKIKIN